MIRSGLWDRTFDSLRERDFRYFWGGMFLLMASSNIQVVARSYLAYDLTGSPLMVGIVGASFAAPVLLFALFGGVIADRFDRKLIIQICQAMGVLIALFVTIAVVTDSVTILHLLGASLGQGVVWSFLMPARQAIIPQIVGKSRMVNAVALTSSGMALTTLAAPGFGGIVYASFGVETVYFVIVALAAGAFVLTSFVPAGGRNDGPVTFSILLEMRQGVRYVIRRDTVMWLLVLGLSAPLLAMPIRSLLPVMVNDLFSRGPEAVGFLMSMFGLGAVIGSLAFAGLRANNPRGLILIISTMLSGLSILMIATTPIYSAALAFMVLGGIGDAGRRTLNSALIMEQTDDEHRGRVMGVYMMSFGLMPLGTIPIAVLAEIIGIRYAITISGILLAFMGAGFMIFARNIRRL